MKIFASEAIRFIDSETILKEGIESVDLMERAAKAFVCRFCELYQTDRPVIICCGHGNNGGDGLAIARLLLDRNYAVTAFLVENESISQDCSLNKSRLEKKYPENISIICSENDFDIFQYKSAIVIDALFGSGLSRPITGIYQSIINQINASGLEIISVDIPSGLFTSAPNNDFSSIVHANRTISFEFPKITFLLSETGKFCGKWEIAAIGLHKLAIENSNTNYSFFEKHDAWRIYKKREQFSHKGTFGHALLMAGSKGMAGAAILAGKAALRTGCGLVSIYGPECNRVICQSACPEIIYHSDENSDCISTLLPDLANYNALGIGCGIGTQSETQQFMIEFLQGNLKPCVIDADGLNILSINKHLIELIPENSILTPHPKEFDRLFGAHTSTWQRIEKAREVCSTRKIVLVLKGAYTAIVTPDSQISFNSSGNSGLATAGSGDVLTGIICSLLAQGYSSDEATKLGVFLHGLAADCTLETETEESLISGDIISNLGKAWAQIQKAVDFENKI